MSTADMEKKCEATELPSAGELLFCGKTNWKLPRWDKIDPSAGNLISPTRIRSLMSIDIRFVASGCASCHCVALDVQGHCYTWGQNEKGQLGHGDTVPRSMPTVVPELSKYKIIRAGAGRNHTVVVTEDGKSFSFGMNKHGQLGTGSTKNEIELFPVACLVSEATNTVCGGDFTVWLSSLEGSTILSAGLPQYGQLGHGTDHEYNSKQSSVHLVYEAQPRPKAIAAFSDKTVVKVACGAYHTVAVDSNGFLYTWGYGGYGRLGHRVQKDEWIPRQVAEFQGNKVLPPNAIISAGYSNSACTAGGGQLYMWGKIKNATGVDWMYPKPLMDLSGWDIRCMDSGHIHHFVGADDSCISWGFAQFGELGYGPHDNKQSVNPKKVESLNHTHVISVACGHGFSLIVVDRTNANDTLKQLEVYEDTSVVEEIEEELNGTIPESKKLNKKRAPEKCSSDSRKQEQKKSAVVFETKSKSKNIKRKPKEKKNIK